MVPRYGARTLGLPSPEGSASGPLTRRHDGAAHGVRIGPEPDVPRVLVKIHVANRAPTRGYIRPALEGFRARVESNESVGIDARHPHQDTVLSCPRILL